MSASASSEWTMGALPRVMVRVNGSWCQAMVDSGCTRTIVHASKCKKWRRRAVVMKQIGGDGWRCQGTAKVLVEAKGGGEAEVSVNVTTAKPFGFECVLGMDVIKRMGGVTILDEATAVFGTERGTSAAAVQQGELRVDEKDFNAAFDPVEKCWTMAWKWRDDQYPTVLKNQRGEYAVPPEARRQYEEVREWIL